MFRSQRIKFERFVLEIQFVPKHDLVVDDELMKWLSAPPQTPTEHDAYECMNRDCNNLLSKQIWRVDSNNNEYCWITISVFVPQMFKNIGV